MIIDRLYAKYPWPTMIGMILALIVLGALRFSIGVTL